MSRRHSGRFPHRVTTTGPGHTRAPRLLSVVRSPRPGNSKELKDGHSFFPSTLPTIGPSRPEGREGGGTWSHRVRSRTHPDRVDWSHRSTCCFRTGGPEGNPERVHPCSYPGGVSRGGSRDASGPGPTAITTGVVCPARGTDTHPGPQSRVTRVRRGGVQGVLGVSSGDRTPTGVTPTPCRKVGSARTRPIPSRRGTRSQESVVRTRETSGS